MKKRNISTILTFFLAFIMLFSVSIPAVAAQHETFTLNYETGAFMLTEDNIGEFSEILTDTDSLLPFELNADTVTFFVSVEAMAEVEDIEVLFAYLQLNYYKYALSSPIHTTPTNDVLDMFSFQCPPHPLTEGYVLQWVGNQPFAVPVWRCTICNATWHRT